MVVLERRRNLFNFIWLVLAQTPQNLPGWTNFIKTLIILQGVVERKFKQIAADAPRQFDLLHERGDRQGFIASHIQNGFGQVKVSLVNIHNQSAGEPLTGAMHKAFIGCKGHF